MWWHTMTMSSRTRVREFVHFFPSSVAQTFDAISAAPPTSARQAWATSSYSILDRSSTAEGQVLKLTSQVALLGVMPMR